MNSLHSHRDRTFTLSELVVAAGELCARVAAGGDDRVRAAPDERTIRYYQSAGLLDRPIRHEGRTAIYGYRQLLQAVAVKALQGQGLSLAQVQAALAGVGTAQLEAAVAEALGQRAPAPAAVPSCGPRPLVSFELAPGVWLTLDPALVADPAALAASLTSLTHTLRSPR